MGTLINLTRNDAREAARLLREFQIHLESAIESSIAPGETEAFSAIDAPHIATDRVKVKSAERLIRKIDIALGDRSAHAARSRSVDPVRPQGQAGTRKGDQDA